ncbi:MAG: hypothetical protein WC614_13745 [bacterium]
MSHRKVALIILAVMFLGIVTGYKLWGANTGATVEKKGDTVKIVKSEGMITGVWTGDRGETIEKIVDKKGDTLEIQKRGGIITGVGGLKINIEKKYGVSFSQLSTMSTKEIDKLVKNSLEDYKEFMNIDFDELVLRKPYKDSTYYENLAHWMVFRNILYDQIYRGIPVYTHGWILGTQIYHDGRICSFGGRFYSNINIPATPSISQTQAFEVAKKHLIEDVPYDYSEINDNGVFIFPKIDAKEKIKLRDSIEVFILPKADVIASLPEERVMDSTVNYYLACKLYLVRKKTGEEWEYWVDMLKGNVLYGYRTKSGENGVIK